MSWPSALSLIGGFFNHAQFFESYLFAWLFWCGLSLGVLVIVMMQFLTGDLWGLAIRRLSEAAFMALPLVALLFIPVLFGIHDLFSWSRTDAIQTPGWVHKHAYLNLPFFVARTIFYFAVVITMALLLRRWSRQQDEGDFLASSLPTSSTISGSSHRAFIRSGSLFNLFKRQYPSPNPPSRITTPGRLPPAASASNPSSRRFATASRGRKRKTEQLRLD